RQHDAPLERLQPNRREEPTPRVALPRVAELLFVEVEGVARLGLEDSLRRPRSEQPRRGRVARVVVAAGQLEPHDVLGVPRFELAPPLLADDVVGGAANAGQRTNAPGRVADA